MRGPKDTDDDEVTIDRGPAWAQRFQDEIKDDFTYVDAAEMTDDDRGWADEAYEAASKDHADDQN